MEWLVVVVLGALGVGLLLAGVHNSAPELFGTIFGTSAATGDVIGTLPGSGHTTVTGGVPPANSGGHGRRPTP